MPGKKKGKGKKGGKSGKKSGGGAPKGGHSDPFAPKDELPLPPRTGESLIKLLTTHPVGERDLYGMKISTRALDNLTPQEISDLKIVFEAFDYRNHGYIGAVDVRRAMRALGFQVSRDQARQMVEETGLKGEGVVDFDEFLDLVIAQQGDSRDVYDEILQGFKMFDYENSGKISMDDLKQACTDANVKFSKEELQDMMIEADLNGDGYVDQEEFIKIMLQTNLF